MGKTLEDPNKKAHETFKKENCRFLFEEVKHKDEFFADVCNHFTTMASKETFSWGWTHNFQGGRYVILVLQRHSLIRNGKVVFRNDKFEPVVGEYSRYKDPLFVLILEENPNAARIIHDGENPLQCKCFSELKDAEDAAIKLSQFKGTRVVIASWFTDYDMY